MRLAVEGHGQGGAAQPADLVFFRESPFGRRIGHPRLEHRAIVQPRGLRRRGKRSEADVDDASGEREDPSVAGHEVGFSGLAVPQLQVGLHDGVRRARRAEIRPVGHSHGPVHRLLAPDGGCQAGGDSPGVDDDGRFEGERLAFGRLCLDAYHPAAALVQDRADDGDVLPQDRAGFLGLRRERGVELSSRAGEAEIGQGGGLRPRQLDRVAAPDRAKAGVARPAARVDAHADKLGHGAGREPVSADFVPRKRRFFEKQHPEAGHGEIVGGRRTGRPRADDDGVGLHIALVHWPQFLCAIRRHNPML